MAGIIELEVIGKQAYVTVVGGKRQVKKAYKKGEPITEERRTLTVKIGLSRGGACVGEGTVCCYHKDKYNSLQGRRWALKRLFENDTAAGRRLTDKDRAEIVKIVLSDIKDNLKFNKGKEKKKEGVVAATEPTAIAQ